MRGAIVRFDDDDDDESQVPSGRTSGKKLLPYIEAPKPVRGDMFDIVVP